MVRTYVIPLALLARGRCADHRLMPMLFTALGGLAVVPTLFTVAHRTWPRRRSTQGKNHMSTTAVAPLTTEDADGLGGGAPEQDHGFATAALQAL